MLEGIALHQQAIEILLAGLDVLVYRVASHRAEGISRLKAQHILTGINLK